MIITNVTMLEMMDMEKSNGIEGFDDLLQQIGQNSMEVGLMIHFQALNVLKKVVSWYEVQDPNEIVCRVPVSFSLHKRRMMSGEP
jgi:hypothetical protein